MSLSSKLMGMQRSDSALAKVGHVRCLMADRAPHLWVAIFIVDAFGIVA